jgi:ATP-dependent DNA helicase 2 subunit 2
MFQESKDELALILYGTDESHNDLADESNYQHITVAVPLSPTNWNMFEEIQKIRPGTATADSKTIEDESAMLSLVLCSG